MDIVFMISHLSVKKTSNKMRSFYTLKALFLTDKYNNPNKETAILFKN